MEYECGLCKADVPSKELVCKACGSRILYKKRTDKRVEHLAR